MDVAASGYPDFLRGARDGESILFDPGHASLWERYFDNSNPLYAPSNTMAVHAAEEATRGRAGLRVLEVGAGCGSGSEALLERLAGRFAAYTATDISPRFLRRARERIAARSPAVERLEFRLLDLNSPPAGWPSKPAGFDLVFAVNVLHSVRDLAAVLGALRGVLAPGGALVLGECVRPARGRSIHAEFVFQLLAEFRNPVLDPELRPEPGFLDAASWRASLARAGFSAVRFVPELAAAVAAYPDHSLAAIVAHP
jgi:SAM-dependent methyltransferase